MLTKPLALIALVVTVLLCNTCTKARHSSVMPTDTTRHSEVNNTSDESWILCSGILVLSPESRYHIAAPMPGIIKSVYWKEGNYVKAGSVLVRLESNDILKLQQDYLETANHLQFLGEEYKRQGELTVENATSMKKMQLAKHDYQSAEIKMNALYAQLNMVGIIADSIKSNMLTPYIELKTPFSGFIFEVNARPGSFVQAGHDLLVICNNRNLFVKLLIPEIIIPFVRKNQKFEFFLASDTITTYEATIQSLAQSIDPENHTAEAFALITAPEDYFLPGMAVQAKIPAKTTMKTK